MLRKSKTIRPAHELVECAHLAVHFAFLQEERQFALVKDLEPFVPGDVIERAVVAVTRKINAQNPFGIRSLPVRAFHHGGNAAAILGPMFDFIVVDGDLGIALELFGERFFPAGF